MNKTENGDEGDEANAVDSEKEIDDDEMAKKYNKNRTLFNKIKKR